MCVRVRGSYLHTHGKVFIEGTNHLASLGMHVFTIHLYGIFVFMCNININKVYYVCADVNDACLCLCTCTIRIIVYVC